MFMSLNLVYWLIVYIEVHSFCMFWVMCLYICRRTYFYGLSFYVEVHILVLIFHSQHLGRLVMGSAFPSEFMSKALVIDQGIIWLRSAGVSLQRL